MFPIQFLQHIGHIDRKRCLNLTELALIVLKTAGHGQAHNSTPDIHSLVSIREFQTPQAIATKLKLSEQETNLILKDLSAMGLIEFLSGRWNHSGKNIHLPSGSIQTIQNHVNWRLRSFDDVSNKSSIHYTTVFTLGKKDLEVLREQLLSFINKQRDTIHESGSEELHVFCCDLFQPFE